MKISVCIPAYRADSVAVTTQSIMRQAWRDWELIAVGQGSLADERVQKVQEIFREAQEVDKRVRYIHLEQTGATRALNAGFAAADGDIIAIIDDDCEAREDWLATIALYFSQDPSLGLVGGPLLKPPKQKRGLAVCPSLEVKEVVYDPVAMDYAAPAGWDWYSANVALRRDVAQQVGPFDKYLGPGAVFPAADDMDYKLRLENLGVRMAATPKLVVHHTHGYRYGFQAIVDHLQNYSYGNGGFAGKLTLLNDPRGPEWIRKEKHERIYRWLRPLRPHKLIRGMLGWRIFKSGYQHCLDNFRVDGVNLRAN